MEAFLCSRPVVLGGGGAELCARTLTKQALRIATHAIADASARLADEHPLLLVAVRGNVQCVGLDYPINYAKDFLTVARARLR